MQALGGCCPKLFAPTRRDSLRITAVKIQSMETFITPSGLVRYHFLFQDPSILKDNINSVSLHSGLGAIDNQNYEDLAFYCNAYNFWSMYLAYDRLEKTDKTWKGNVTFLERLRFFKLTKITVGRKKTDLYSLENDVIRKFGDPRIHFAINCSSMSCPPLPTYLFTASQLNEQFEEQTRRFINHGGVRFNRKPFGLFLKNAMPENLNTVEVSSIFKWYAADFKASSFGSIKAFINYYLEDGKITDGMNITYMDYDWEVNWAKTE